MLSVESHVGFLVFCFLPHSCGDSPWRGTCRECPCGLCRLLGPLSANVMDSVLKNSVLISMASLLVIVYGELLPFQPFLSQSVIFNVLYVDRQKSRTVARMPRVLGVSMLRWSVSGNEGNVGTISAPCAAFSNLPEV